MHPSDEELVARAVTVRDQAAFGELVRRHQSRVRSWLRQLTRNPATADDIAQDTFIKAWDKLHTFGGQGRFAAWLMKIAYTEFLMTLRKAKAELRLADEERVVMLLCYAQGLSHGEASEITGMPVGTIKSHIHRGKEKIRLRFFPEEVPHE